MRDERNRPAVSAALSKGYGVATNTQFQNMQARRPSSARPLAPARMSADLQSLQAAINKFRSPKAFKVPSQTDNGIQDISKGLQPRPASSGVFKPGIVTGAGCFRNSAGYVRAQYPDIDVQLL
jgi:hypothetical protein